MTFALTRTATSLFTALAISLTSLSLIAPTAAQANPLCLQQFELKAFSPEKADASLAKSTKLEQQFPFRLPPLSAEEQLTAAMEKLKEAELKQGGGTPLFNRVRAARERKAQGKSLQVDFSNLTAPMVFFLDGAFKKVVGNRGLSAPFMDIRALDSNRLVIHHAGDRFPMMVRWSESAPLVRRAHVENIDGVKYRVLELPSTLRTQSALASIETKYIFSLISASQLNRWSSSAGNIEMTIASLLHDEAAFFDRPTQEDAKELRALRDRDTDLRKAVRSLLFIAPTATGKTRILGDEIVNKVRGALAAMKSSSSSQKKLTVLMTKTPDLTGALALNIGTQLYNEVGPRNFRLVQWGGDLSETGALAELQTLLTFIDKSNVPVVLVTSYPTLGARIASDAAMKSLFERANLLGIDEAHNAGGDTFARVFRAASDVAHEDRSRGNVLGSLDILGVTASPITSRRTIEVFDNSFWGAIDTPSSFAKRVEKADDHPFTEPYKNVLEWVRILEQYERARDRGEINAPDETLHYRPKERGFAFDSIFKRAASGSQPVVSIERLREIWPDVSKLIEDHGPGVIQTYPRDADVIAATLSALTGESFVSLQSLSVHEREAVYKAFAEGSEYRGKPVKAIVGTIREGLDFPQAGWYLNFKKYVKFPENIQGPGRVMRLAVNKLPPVVIFFGEEVNRIAYEKVRELIMARMGRLPNSIANGRFYKGARRPSAENRLAKSVDELNTALEAMMRIRSDLAKVIGQGVKNGAGDLKNTDPKAVEELQEFLRTIRHSGSNREIAAALNKFVYEVNSFPFFIGDLSSTWAYCSRLIAAEKLPSPPKRMSAQDLAVLQSPEQMAMVHEFRDMYGWLGAVPRLLLGTMGLRPNNLRELARAVEAYVARNGRLPDRTGGPESLGAQMIEAVRVSPDAFFKHLNDDVDRLIAELPELNQGASFEQALLNFFNSRGSLPEFDFDRFEDSTRNVADSNESRLAEHLQERLPKGKIEVSQLVGQPALLAALDASPVLKKMAPPAVAAAINMINGLKNEPGFAQARLTYRDFEKYEAFGVLRVIRELAQLGLPNSMAYKQQVEAALNPAGQR